MVCYFQVRVDDMKSTLLFRYYTMDCEINYYTMDCEINFTIPLLIMDPLYLFLFVLLLLFLVCFHLCQVFLLLFLFFICLICWVEYNYRPHVPSVQPFLSLRGKIISIQFNPSFSFCVISFSCALSPFRISAHSVKSQGRTLVVLLIYNYAYIIIIYYSKTCLIRSGLGH